MGEYQDHYNMQDVIQLIDIETNFSKNIHNGFKIESFSFVTLASFSASREASPKTTKKKLELLTHVNMILYAEKGIRGGITRAICHYAEDSNIYMCNSGKVKKVIALCILVLTISIDELYCYHFPALDLNLLKIEQWLHQWLSWTVTQKGMTFDVDYPVYLQPLHRNLLFLLKKERNWWRD